MTEPTHKPEDLGFDPDSKKILRDDPAFEHLGETRRWTPPAPPAAAYAETPDEIAARKAKPPIIG